VYFYLRPVSAEIAPKPLNLWKLLIPLSIGIGSSAFLLYKMNLNELYKVTLTQKLIVGLLLAALTVVLRDGAFMYKIWLSSGKHMTWRKTFQTITMWEFSACVTPKVSEAPFILFILKQSGLSYGKSVAVLMLNAFLDNMAFVVVWTILYLLLGSQMLTFGYNCADLAGKPVLQTLRNFGSYAWIGYLLILGLSLFLAVALFIVPHATRKFFHYLATLPLLNRFKSGLIELGNEVELTANEFKGKSTSFWVGMCVATFINWIARYLLAVALLYAFAVTDFNFLLSLSRQYVLWIFTGVPSTPGAAGVAEVSFTALNCEFAPQGLAAAIAVVWRLYSYYFYIALGLLLLPKWARQIAGR